MRGGVMRLNSQVRQYDGFTPGRRVSGRTPKMQGCTIDNPFRNDVMNPTDSPFTQTHQAIAHVMDIQKASLEIDFNGKFEGTLNHLVQDLRIRQFFFRCDVDFYKRSPNDLP